MATTHADVISADLLAFIKGQAAYRSGVLPRSAVQSTAQLNEWFRMTPVYASEGRRAPGTRVTAAVMGTRGLAARLVSLSPDILSCANGQATAKGAQKGAKARQVTGCGSCIWGMSVYHALLRFTPFNSDPRATRHKWQ
jgi:hypothetical protein